MNYTFNEKLSGMWRILRPIDGIIMGIGLILAMVLSGSVGLGIPLLFYILVFLGGFLVTGHAMVVNDVIDIEIDKINEPRRVLPQGIISLKSASIYSVILAAIGIFLFFVIDLADYDQIPLLWLFVLFHVLLADFYNYKLKGTGFIGNIVVAEMSYALFLAADLFLNGHLTLVPQIVGITGFCASLSREVFKGIIDQEGDREHNIKTVAVVFGPRFAKYLATSILSFCLALFVYLFPRVLLLGQIGLIICTLLFLYLVYLARNAEIPLISRKIKNFILIGPLILSPFLIADNLLQLTL